MNLKNLNKEQQQAVTFSGRHLLVLAGAGTGKTTTIVSRVSWLIEQGVSPSRIKIISFTRKSASDIALRARAALPEGASAHALIQGSTFHGWCLEIIRSYPQVFGMQNWNVIDTDDQESVFRTIMENPSYKCLCGTRVSSLISLCSYIVNTGMSLPDAVRRSEDCSELPCDALSGLFAGYSEYKTGHCYLDYDDLISIVADRLQSDTAFRSHLLSRYDHILVDEMQDTNHLQWKLLEVLATSCSLFCVGDDAQSIYSFRGADFSSIHSFTRRIPDSQVIRLVRNYRSTQPLLDVSNALLQQSPLSYDKNLVAVRKGGRKPRLVFTRNQKDEAAFVSAEISGIVSRGGAYSDNMVLVRSSYQAKQLESQFISHGIPYRLFGGTSIVRSSHVRDVMSAARVIANPDDTLAWSRFLSLWKGVGKAKLKDILSRLSFGGDITDKLVCIQDIPLVRGACQVLSSAVIFRDSAATCIRCIADGMQSLLAARYPSDWERRTADLDLLVSSAAGSGSLSAFVSEYLVDTVTDSGESGDFVTVSTIHSAKGLEADNVFVLDITAGNYPSPLAVRNGAEQIEEERRCLYVALTRARKMMYLLTDYATWSMTEPLRTDMDALACGARFQANHPDESAAPLVFPVAEVVSVESDYVCYRTDDGRTRYSIAGDFLCAYRPVQDRNPALSVPHFLFACMDVRLFDCTAFLLLPAARQKATAGTNDFSFF